MTLSIKQKGVLKGMAMAMLTSVIVIVYAINADPFSYAQNSQVSDRLSILGLSLILPILLLIASIGRLAKYRFFSPEDIDGSGLTSATNTAFILQSLLQNTLEQLVTAIGVYSAWCILMPSVWLSAVPLCSVLFVIGRILFFKGYTNQYKKLIYSERFWQANSRRINDIMVIPL